MARNLSIQKFDMSKLNFDRNKVKGPTIVLLGKRNTGKSYLVKDILYHNRDVPVGTVISPTEQVSPFYIDMIPKCFIHNAYHSHFIENLLKRQLTIVQQHNSEKIQYGRSNTDARAFAILDDCLASGKSWSKDELIRTIFMNGRHLKVLFILTMQYPIGIGPDLRSNIDFVFILRNAIMAERRKIYEHYAGVLPSFEFFCKLLDNCTDNYECLVIDNTVQTNDWTKCTYWYKAEEHTNFRLGSRQYWDMSRNMAEGDADDGAPLNFGRRSSSSMALNIRKVS